MQKQLPGDSYTIERPGYFNPQFHHNQNMLRKQVLDVPHELKDSFLAKTAIIDGIPKTMAVFILTNPFSVTKEKRSKNLRLFLFLKI